MPLSLRWLSLAPAIDFAVSASPNAMTATGDNRVIRHAGEFTTAFVAKQLRGVGTADESYVADAIARDDGLSEAKAIASVLFVSARSRARVVAGNVRVGERNQGRSDSRDHAFVGGEPLSLHA